MQIIIPDLEGVNWDIYGTSQGSTEDVNEQWERFKTDFNAVADRHAPLIQKKSVESTNAHG